MKKFAAKKRNVRTGGTLKAALAAEGLLKDAEAVAQRRVTSWQAGKSTSTRNAFRTRIKPESFRNHNVATIESLKKDPAFAATYLDAVLADGDQEELMTALRRVSDAFGGIKKLAGMADLNATTLYRTLSPTGNPELRSMNALLKAMGMRLSVQSLKKSSRRRAA
jgi:probable addiction module antidote protein